MKDLKISDKLLRWVFGCECRLGEIVNVNTPNTPEYSIVYVKGINSATLGVYEKEYYINIDTFARFAKIKAFECGYIVDEQPYHTTILSKRNDFLQSGDYPEDDIFSIETVIMMLEWVAEKAGDKR